MQKNFEAILMMLVNSDRLLGDLESGLTLRTNVNVIEILDFG